MDCEHVLEILNKIGAVIRNSHIVYASGRHGTDYVDKDRVGLNPIALSLLGAAIACEIRRLEPEVVVSPAIGAIALGQWVAYHLSALKSNHTDGPVAFVIADKERLAIDDPEGKGRKCFYESGKFILRPKDSSLVAGKRVIVVEDILTTGASAKAVVETVKEIGGVVALVAVLVNRGAVDVEGVGSPGGLFALLNLTLPSWDAHECSKYGPCHDNIPINTSVGKGKEFMARMKKQS